MKTKSFAQVLSGLVVVGLGIGFLLDSLNFFEFGRVLSDWWPLLIVFVGLASLLSNPRVFLWPLVMVAVGTLLQLRELELITFNIWGLIWPSILIVVGLSILFERIGPKPQETHDDSSDLFVAFSGIETKNKSSDFTGGKITALFGGVTLDLRDAEIKDKAVIDIFVACGGVELTVPDGWEVRASGLPLFGGWEDKTRKPTGKNAPVLIIRGTCLFGGVDIKN